jgi:hypothetical protein
MKDGITAEPIVLRQERTDVPFSQAIKCLRVSGLPEKPASQIAALLFKKLFRLNRESGKPSQVPAATDDPIPLDGSRSRRRR